MLGYRHVIWFILTRNHCCFELKDDMIKALSILGIFAKWYKHGYVETQWSNVKFAFWNKLTLSRISSNVDVPVDINTFSKFLSVHLNEGSA